MPKKRNLITCESTTEDITKSKTFAEAIEHLMEINGWFANGLADYLGCSPKHIYCMLKGKEDLSIKLALKLQELSKIDCLFWIKLYVDSYKRKEED